MALIRYPVFRFPYWSEGFLKEAYVNLVLFNVVYWSHQETTKNRSPMDLNKIHYFLNHY